MVLTLLLSAYDGFTLTVALTGLGVMVRVKVKDYCLIALNLSSMQLVLGLGSTLKLYKLLWVILAVIISEYVLCMVMQLQ